MLLSPQRFLDYHFRMWETIAFTLLTTLWAAILLSYYAVRFFAHKLSDRAFDIYLGALWCAWFLFFWGAALLFPDMIGFSDRIDWTSCFIGAASGMLVIVVLDLMYSVEEGYALPRWLPDLTIVMSLVVLLGWVWYYIEHPTKDFHSAALGVFTGASAAFLFHFLRK
jgi:hypothetical protein